LTARTIGVDTGGTFTDVVLAEGEDVRVAKVPSTPEDPARAVLAGLACLEGPQETDHVVHGTTVALNALLTGKLARVGLVTNQGFRDLIEIGRQDRPDIYALHPTRPGPLVDRARRFEVPERIWPAADGNGFETVSRATRAQLAELRARVERSGAESIAVCLLHSWADDSGEQRVARALRSLHLPITTSASILAEHREYERFSTAIVNAALTPLMRDYLGGLGQRLQGARLSILQSNGGTLAAERAAEEPVRVILSGPAGGVVGAAREAHEAGFGAFVGLDMGGTSTDVAFHDPIQGEERHATRAAAPVRIAGHPVAVPSLDIHTIGCGGGSLVTVDAGGVLHVGPESAGADPGPVCYGASDVPTVTDAHVLLRHIAEGAFLRGGLALDRDRVERAFERLGKRLGAGPTQAARGVLEVARAAMRRAIGVMTMQRGQDPERLPLVAFGGAGGLHAAALAANLGMRAAVVPLHPGALSARGMTGAGALRDLAHTALDPLGAWPRKRRRDLQREFEAEGKALLREAGHAARSITFEHGLDLRYRGQSFEIHVPECRDPESAFQRAHEELYGYALAGREIELVCLRTRARVLTPLAPPARTRARKLPGSAIVDERRAVFDRPRKTPVIARSALKPGHSFEGPALVEQYSGTTIVPPGWHARVAGGGHLVLRR